MNSKEYDGTEPAEHPRADVRTGPRPGRAHRHNLRVHQAEVNGRHPWVLEDDAGILELADAEETLRADHPELRPLPPADHH